MDIRSFSLLNLSSYRIGTMINDSTFLLSIDAFSCRLRLFKIVCQRVQASCDRVISFSSCARNACFLYHKKGNLVLWLTGNCLYLFLNFDSLCVNLI